MVFGLLHQVQIFSQLYLLELLGLLTDMELLEPFQGFHIFKAFDRVWYAGLLHKLKSYGISDQIFGLISSFVRMESLHKNIQLMLEFLKPIFLVLPFSCYTSMTFLAMLSVILLSMLMILPSILSVIKHLISGNYLNWLLNLNLIYETLWTEVGSGLLISMLGKPSWLRLTGLTTVVLLM